MAGQDAWYTPQVQAVMFTAGSATAPSTTIPGGTSTSSVAGLDLAPNSSYVVTALVVVTYAAAGTIGAFSVEYNLVGSPGSFTYVSGVWAQADMGTGTTPVSAPIVTESGSAGFGTGVGTFATSPMPAVSGYSGRATVVSFYGTLTVAAAAGIYRLSLMAGCPSGGGMSIGAGSFLQAVAAANAVRA